MYSKCDLYKKTNTQLKIQVTCISNTQLPTRLFNKLCIENIKFSVEPYEFEGDNFYKIKFLLGKKSKFYDMTPPEFAKEFNLLLNVSTEIIDRTKCFQERTI